MGGPTRYRGGEHLAVRVRLPDDYARFRLRVDKRTATHCLYCHHVRNSYHVGTVWLEPGDPRILPSLGHSQNDQSEVVRDLAFPEGMTDG